MKAFNVIAAQGEITIRRLGDLPPNSALPEGFTAITPENGRFIIGHSETGHHHVIEAFGAMVGVMDEPPPGMRILYAIVENSLSLQHLRGRDTHETLTNAPGIYEIRIAREFDHYAELTRPSRD